MRVDEETENVILDFYRRDDAELYSLADWCDTIFLALARLRDGAWRLDLSRDEITLAELSATIGELETRLAPRLKGLRAALVRAHYAAGGSHGELSRAMDTNRATAQTRASRVRGHAPGHWEKWASGEVNPPEVDAADLRPGDTLVYTETGRRSQITEVRVYGDGYVEIETGDHEGGAFCFERGDTATAVRKNGMWEQSDGTQTVAGQDMAVTIYRHPSQHTTRTR